MNNINVNITKKKNLCVSCEICSAVCPKNAISFELLKGQFLPKIKNSDCVNCHLCLDVCPGINIDPFNIRNNKFNIRDIVGAFIECYTAYSKDLKIRKKSVSGGLITTLIRELIKQKTYDYAFVLKFRIFNNSPVRITATNKVEEILEACKSKYLPASAYEIIEELSKKNGKKYVIIGTPCQIRGIKNFLEKKKISEKNLLFLGLFCDKTLNFNFIKYIENNYGKNHEKLIKLHYRTKEKFGWPGNIKAVFSSGRKILIDKEVRIALKKFFQLERCLYCYDKLNRLSDLSFGDCYIQDEKDLLGKSNVIVRTIKGKEVIHSFSYLFKLKKVDINEISKSQKLEKRKRNIDFVKYHLNQYSGSSQKQLFKYNKKNVKKLLKLKKYIKYGQEYNLRMIKLYLLILNTFNRLKSGISLSILILKLIKGIIKNLTVEKFINYNPNLVRTNIILIGGELSSIGAQAMTFTMVDLLKKKFPKRKIFLFSRRDCLTQESVKRKYDFKIICWSKNNNKYNILDYPDNLFKKFDKPKEFRGILKIFKRTAVIIDISGYKFTSQWGFCASFQYLINLMIAKKFSIPYYIFPQSFGPFEYPFYFKLILYPLMYIYLKYPKKIFVREKKGFNYLLPFTKENVEKSMDLVFLNKNIDLKNIFKEAPKLKIKRIKRNSVGIIPNVNLFKYGKNLNIYNLYIEIINLLLKNDKIIYLLIHSYEDKNIILNLKREFPSNPKVKLFVDNFNFFELEEIIKKFQFVIASRYHSIINAYNNETPVIGIGWSNKYFEIMEFFFQINYHFDVRYGLKFKNLKKAIRKMLCNWKNESERIKTIRMNIKNEEILTVLDTI